jgi:hypothetical protein
LQILCDGCACDLTHSIRIKCAAEVCEQGDGVDICPACFCAGKEFGMHKRDHPYRVVVSHPNLPAHLALLSVDNRSCILTLYSLKTGEQMSEHVCLFDILALMIKYQRVASTGRNISARLRKLASNSRTRWYSYNGGSRETLYLGLYQFS